MPDFETAPLVVRFRGVRGSIPSPGFATTRYGGNTSCVELRCGKSILILDAGTGIRALGDDLLKEFGSAPITANLLISHTHWDHIQGFPFFAPLYHPRHWVHVFAAPGHGSRVEQGLCNQMHFTHFPVDLNRMPALCGIDELGPKSTFIGPFSIRTMETNHPGGCAAFHIRAGGVSVVYAPDHEPEHSTITSGTVTSTSSVEMQSLVDFIQNVDLLILDTQYTAAEYSHRTGWGHGCLPDSVAMAMQGNVKHLTLFHHDPSHNDDQVDEMLATAKDLASESRLAISGASENETLVIEPAHISTPELAAQNVVVTV
jgi:phosphoribosyl 1,2-cyclic phosphodiesterase